MMEASNHTDELPYESHDLSFSRLVLMLVLVLGVLSGVPFRSVWGGIVSGIARVGFSHRDRERVLPRTPFKF